MQFVTNVGKRSQDKNSHFLYNHELKMNVVKLKTDFSQTIKESSCKLTMFFHIIIF